MLLICGLPASGKSTLLEAVHATLGECATTADLGTFLGRGSSDGGHATPHLARLDGRRLVTSYEIEPGARLNESLVSQITGGDPITARGLYRESFEYIPQFTPVLVSNHYPQISGDDSGVWRRLRVIHFDQAIPADQRDHELKARLRETQQSQAILVWMVEGCLAWQRQGLAEPPGVRLATYAYMHAMDFVQQFIDECLVWSDGGKVSIKEMNTAYAEWCQLRQVPQRGTIQLTKDLERRGYVRRKSGSSRYWSNVTLRPTETHPVHTRG